MARQLLARLAVTPDAAVPDLPFLHRALLLPLLSAASVLLRLPLLLSSSPLRPRRTLPVPVVSVGNLTWGGNGKTPMVDFLARRFHNIGISPLILTRGYAGGDESKMLQRRLADTTTKLGIGANRAAVASSVLQKYGYVDPCEAFLRKKLSSARNRMVNGTKAKIGVAIMDDGMQHRSLLRDVEIVMVNGLTPWGNGHFIPRGPMREPLSALTRADILVIHHANLDGISDRKPKGEGGLLRGQSGEGGNTRQRRARHAGRCRDRQGARDLHGARQQCHAAQL